MQYDPCNQLITKEAVIPLVMGHSYGERKKGGGGFIFSLSTDGFNRLCVDKLFRQ